MDNQLVLLHLILRPSNFRPPLNKVTDDLNAQRYYYEAKFQDSSTNHKVEPPISGIELEHKKITLFEQLKDKIKWFLVSYVNFPRYGTKVGNIANLNNFTEAEIRDYTTVSQIRPKESKQSVVPLESIAEIKSRELESTNKLKIVKKNLDRLLSTHDFKSEDSKLSVSKKQSAFQLKQVLDQIHSIKTQEQHEQNSLAKLIRKNIPLLANQNEINVPDQKA